MRGITVLKALAVVLLVLAPATASATIFASDEKTTATLIGEDGKGNSTIFLKQTQTGTDDFVFVLTLAVTSNFEFQECRKLFSSVIGPDEVKGCERDLWVAVLLPDRRLFFLELRPQSIVSLQDAGSLDNLPFLPGILPYSRLGSVVFLDPYFPIYVLFGLSQTVVNALPPGRYTIFAGFTTRVESGTDLSDLFAKAVSNVDQYDVIIEEVTVPCNESQVAGGDTPDTRVIDLNNIAGTFRFDFQTFTQKDRMIVSYEGQVGFDTGCVGTSGSVLLQYSGSSTKVTVQVFPNCAGGSGTAWNYTVHCPTTGAFNSE